MMDRSWASHTVGSVFGSRLVSIHLTSQLCNNLFEGLESITRATSKVARFAAPKAPSTKIQVPGKHQDPIIKRLAQYSVGCLSVGIWDLFGIWGFPGAWSLELGG